MAADLSPSEEASPISAINVTPFVDVVLVLLVIFMITAPVLSKELLEVHLPKAQSGEQKTYPTLGVAITQQGQILMNGQLVNAQALSENVKNSLKSNPDIQAVISADGEAKHSDVVKVIDIIKSAGLSRFALQVQRPE